MPRPGEPSRAYANLRHFLENGRNGRTSLAELPVTDQDPSFVFLEKMDTAERERALKDLKEWLGEEIARRVREEMERQGFKPG